MEKTIKLNQWQIAQLENALNKLERIYSEQFGENEQVTCDVRKLAMLIEDATEIKVK